MIYDWTDSYYRYLHEFLLEEIARRYDLSYLGPMVEFAMGYNLQIGMPIFYLDYTLWLLA